MLWCFFRFVGLLTDSSNCGDTVQRGQRNHTGVGPEVQRVGDQREGSELANSKGPCELPPIERETPCRVVRGQTDLAPGSTRTRGEPAVPGH